MEWRGGVACAAGAAGAACAAGAAGLVGGRVWMGEAGLELAWRSWRV